MIQDDDAFFVITGGPGSGKTTLLAALAAVGCATAPEGGRAIIRDQVAIDGPGLPWRDRGLFAELMLGWDMRSHAEAQQRGGLVLFDRGVPDVAGYLALSGLAIPAHVARAARQIRYRRLVFAAPPWREIFAQDAERKQDFAEAERTFAAVTGSYRDFGYEPVELPLASVAERVAFVRARIAAG
ncbi:AAA family ATPase [Bosea sp. (in: a-proteobacteria)]|uniref:AAA family ATPase n=1 Tax=Bosea sp. (in: a-proteobacteria) TaxID=1871050 RepID=UPI002FCC9EE7